MDSLNGLGSIFVGEAVVRAVDGLDRSKEKLTESRKEEILNRCHDADSEKEFHKIIEDEVPNGDMEELRS